VGLDLNGLFGCRLESFFSVCDLMVGSYKHGNIRLGSIKGGEFLESLQYYQPWRMTLLDCVIIIYLKFVEYYFVFNFRLFLFT
jgi:hypothetical protein